MAVLVARRRSRGTALLALALAVSGVVVAPLGLSWCATGSARSVPVGTRSGAVARRAEAEFAEPGNAVGDAGTTPLMLAAYKNDVEEVKKYSANGADLNLQDDYGWTAMRYAVRANNKEATEVLIAAGADINKASASGRTPLMSAASNGFSEMVEILLKGGADKNAKNGNGETALELSKRGGPTGCKKCQALLTE